MILTLAAGTQAPPPVADTREADAQAIRDVEAAVSIYAGNAQLIIPGMAPTSGPAAIKSTLSPIMGDPNLALTFESAKVEVSKGGDYGYSVGSYSMTSTNPQTKKPATEKGTYVTVFQKQADGAWKAITDINAAGPPPAPAK